MGERTETITINSYQKVWGYEKMLYQITDTLSLPGPVVEADAMYFLSCLVLVFFAKLAFKIPVSSPFVGLFLFLGIPLGVTAVLRYKTFDGKNPLVFLGDYLCFVRDRGRETEFFLPVAGELTHSVRWRMGYRHRLRLRVTQAERRSP